MIRKTTRSILSVLLAALLLVTSTPLTPAFAGDGGAVSPQSESGERKALTGEGTAGNPYKIATADDLLEFADKVNNQDQTSAWAELTADIDLSEICGENIGGQSVSWTPIGSISQKYTGTFNGDGHTVSGLYINNSTADYQGLFGYVGTRGTVQNLTVSGSVSVSGSDHVGGIVGYNSFGTVTNCTFSGSVSGSDHVGGVVGYNFIGGSVTNSYNTGTVTGTSTDDYVGGVVGYNDGGIVENCYNIGKVTGSADSSNVGGVVGQNSDSGSVTNCYNTGSVSGPYSGTGSADSSNVGGVVGQNSDSSIVENCYNTGAVNSSGNRVGGVVGYNISSVTGCYFLQTTGVNESLQGIGSDEAIGTTGATAVNDLDALCEALEDSDTTGTWSLSENLGRPVLTSNHEDDGSKDHPYEIFTATQLENFRDIVHGANNQTADPDAHAKLMNNIDLEGSETNLWTPIGTSKENAYTGTFDGNGKTISGLYIDSRADYQGLFGYVGNTGTVQNLTVSGSVKGHSYVGGVVGYNNGGTVTGCIFSGSGSVSGSDHVGGVVGRNYGSVTNSYNTGSVTSSGNTLVDNEGMVGGVVGRNGGTVTNSYNIGEVSGDWHVGGVVGRNDGTVKNCYNTGTGTVTGTVDYVGGVVGQNFGGTVENCYNTGSVKGPDSVSDSWYVGGVVGDNSGTVENCYNTGSVTVTGSDGRVGGVVGYNGGTVENCHNIGDVSGIGSVGGIVGYNVDFDGYSASVENCYNTGSVTGVAGVTGSSDYVGGVVGQNFGGTVENCYNTGTVSSSGGHVDGVVGDNRGTVKNCYYQIDKGAIVGIGGTTADDTTTVAKTAAEFQSGEVAWLLENGQAEDQTTPVWGQNLMNEPKDNYPQLRAFDADTPQVYKVAFMNDNEEHDAKYANIGMTVDLPATEPTKEGYTFSYWQDKGGTQVTESITVTADTEFTAQWTANTYSITASPSTLNFGSITEGEERPAAQTVTVKNTGNQTVTLNPPTANNFEITTSDSLTLAPNATATATFTIQPKDNLPRGSYSEQITITGDNNVSETLTATFTVKEPPYSGKYSYEISTDIGDNGALSVDRYATEGEKVTITVTPDEAYKLDDLTVTAHGKDVELTANSDGTYTFTMPSADVKITATFAEDPDWTEPEEPATDVSDIFLDVAPNAWYKDAVQYAYDHGLMTGVSATEFAPEATTTRAMIVSILARLEGVESAQAAGFADVDDNDWYATAVNWAASVGVVNGYEDNTFRPNTAITREQLAAILMNYAAYKGEDVSARADLDNYTDQPSTWAEEAMSWAVAEGLISGVTNTELQPQGNATRAQVAAILQRYLEA